MKSVQTATATRESGRHRAAADSRSYESPVCLRALIHQHRPGYRDSGTPVRASLRAFPLGAAVRAMRTVYRGMYGLYAASQTVALCARTRDDLYVPGAALYRWHVLHRWHVLRVQLFQGRQSLTAWQYSFSQDMSYESGELPLAEQSARKYWRSVEGGTVLSHNLLSLQKIYVMILQKQS